MSRGKRYTAEQIIKILREVEIYTGQGETVAQGCRRCSISEQTYYRWRKWWCSQSRLNYSHAF